MTPENEIKLLFETFAFCSENIPGEHLDKCKKGNEYFFKQETGLKVTCEMIIKMQKVMFGALPIQSSERYQEQFDRMNRIVKQCKQFLKEIENEKEN